jgi:hypothetical protein
VNFSLMPESRPAIFTLHPMPNPHNSLCHRWMRLLRHARLYNFISI